MYTQKNFKSKKELKAAVEAWNAHATSTSTDSILPRDIPRPVTYFQPGPFGGNEPRDGTVYIEGPHFPAAHTFYAACTVKDEVIVKVK